MAGDWIKMRTSLLTNPKVNGIARALESSRDVSRALSTGFTGDMSEIVTRNVMRHVTVSSLLIVWGAANEHTDDGVFKSADLSDIDDMVGIPGFGEAMESVGWAEYDPDANTVTLPNFNEYNTSGSSRSANAKSAAQRQKEYRERKKSRESDVTRDVTSDVTRNRREEKSREESNTQPIGCGDETGVSPTAYANGVQTSRQTADNCPHQQIIDLYHKTLPTGRQVREWTPARQAALRSRWRENPKRQNLDWWGRYFAYCAQSKFLTGQTHSPGRRPFELSLDWLVKSENMAKVIEGAYHESETEAA